METVATHTIKKDVRSVSEVGMVCLELADDLERGDSIRAELYLLRRSDRFARRTLLGSVEVKLLDDGTYGCELTMVVNKDGDTIALSFEHDGLNPPAIHDYSATTSRASFFASNLKTRKAA